MKFFFLFKKKALSKMTLFRLPLNIKETFSPSLEIISKLKGTYGIECIFLNQELELFLFIQDKHILKFIEKDSKNQILVYFNLFGLGSEVLENSEIINDDYLKEKIPHCKTKFLTYFDLSNLLIIENPIQNYQKENFHNPNLTMNYEKGLIQEISKFLIKINISFIIQIFFSSRKRKLLLGGQIVVFSILEDDKFLIGTIKETLDKLLLKFKIKLEKTSKSNLVYKISLKNFYNHIPIKLFYKSPVIVNDLVKIPKFDDLSTFFNHIENNYQFQMKDNLNDGIPIGIRIIPGIKNPPVIKISFEELTSHFCCFGITSQGKSRLMYNFLSFVDKTNKNFLVIDPKGEYFEALAKSSKSIRYFKIGSYEFPLFLNIFSVPDGLSSENHIHFIYSLLLGIMGDDVTPQMNRLLFKGVEYIVNNNLTMKDFVSLLETPEKLKIKGSYLELSGGAILNRILPLLTGPAKNCFYSDISTVNFSELIINNVIIDLSNFELIESTISRKVFVNTFLHYFIHTIRRRNYSIRNLGDISNFILIEEIQKIAPLTYQGKNEINSFIGLAPWTVRAYGICMGFIGTDLNVETPIITNTGLSLIFYSKSNIESKLKILGVSFSEYQKFLNDLKERKKFLVCYKGTLELVQSFDFQMPI